MLKKYKFKIFIIIFVFIVIIVYSNISHNNKEILEEEKISITKNVTYSEVSKTYDIDKITKELTDWLKNYGLDESNINKELESKQFLTYEIKFSINSNITTSKLNDYLKNDKGIPLKGNYTIMLETLETENYIQVLNFEVLQNDTTIEDVKLNKEVWVDIEPVDKPFKKNSDELAIALVISGTKDKVDIFTTEYRHINLETGEVTKRELTVGE